MMHDPLRRMLFFFFLYLCFRFGWALWTHGQCPFMHGRWISLGLAVRFHLAHLALFTRALPTQAYRGS